MSRFIHSRRGDAWHTALGFLALGFASALFGALVVGPRLAPGEKAAHAASEPPREHSAPARTEPRPRRDAERELARDVTRAVARASSEEQPEEREEPKAPAAEVEIREAPRAEAAPKPEETAQPEPDRPAEEPKAEEKPAATPAAEDRPRTRREREDKSPTERPATAEATPEAKPAEATRFYRVSVGRFDTQEEAQQLRQEILEKTGKAAHLVQLADGFRVQMGAFRHRTNAERAAEELRGLSYRPRVILDRTPATQ
jgi:hypothetical protein